MSRCPTCGRIEDADVDETFAALREQSAEALERARKLEAVTASQDDEIRTLNEHLQVAKAHLAEQS